MLSNYFSNNDVIYIKAKLGNLFFNFGDIDGAQEEYLQVVVQASDIDTDVFAQMIYNYAMIKY